MKQITQNLKSGVMSLLDVPVPSADKGQVLVRNHYSLISAGTEGSKVATARKGYLGKAKEKPEAVKQVLDSVKTEGLKATYQKVMNKLDAPSPLGYSCAGEVIAVGDGVTSAKVGDRVACGGADVAVHAEVVCVPENLCARIPDEVSLQDAAYTTVASIALQGIRQADLRLGENCVVIGLGLLGQLTVQMLKQAGIKVLGIDMDPRMVELAIESGADIALERSSLGIEDAALSISGGHGVDAVIITAGTSSLDPIELSGTLCRQKGRVVVVGAVPTGFSRTNYYIKELELRMSCSYGPGRYDANYEDKGLDYPIGYVRWTENRNMQAFLSMASKLNLDLLTSHVFDLEDALDAFNMIVDKTEPFVGIALRYDTKKEVEKVIRLDVEPGTRSPTDPRIGFVGAGSFAQKNLLPIAKKYGEMISVATASGHSARNVADKYGFRESTANAEEVFTNAAVNTVFIATRHNLHAEQVIRALEMDKHVFVEKPLCLTLEELERITALQAEHKRVLMVGFNRRFAPFTEKILKMVKGDSPRAMNFRVNAGSIPKSSWVQDKNIGGGRILGEFCHFVDLALCIAGSPIRTVSAVCMDDAAGLMDTLTAVLSFANGSVANISYFSNGSSSMKKERLEVFSNGCAAVIDDFNTMTVYGRKAETTKIAGQNKGHAKEVELFLKAIKDGEEPPIPVAETLQSTQVTFDVLRSIRERQTIVY